MKSYERMTRVDELLKREIADLLEKRLEHLENVLITVTEVKASPDLRHAKVCYSVLGGGDAAAKLAAKILRKERGYLQNKIARDLKIKHTPVLTFDADTRGESAERVLAIISELEEVGDDE